MKKKKINKTRLKIFIALTLMFTLITTIFIGTKSFAYDTRDNLSYTTSISEITNNNFTDLQYKSFVDSDNNSKSYIELPIGAVSTWQTFNIKINVSDVQYLKYYCFLVNFDVGYESGGVWNSTISTSNYYQWNVNYGSNYQSNSQYFTNSFSQNNQFNYKYRTQYIQFNTTGANNNISFNNLNDIQIGFRYPSSSSSTKLRIYNIDFVKQDEVTLTNYYSSLQEQYTQLLNQYDELQDDYSQLENDYTFLEDDYNELENDYDTLENEYNDLQQDLENLTQTIDNGLWSYTSGVVAFGNGYGANYTTYDDIINANIIKDFTFDCIKTYPTYTQQNNGISGNVFIVMGVLPDENTSNWEEVKYTPANLLNFNVNTNITDYIKITIDLTTINNAYQNKILQINKSNIELMNYEITSEKLEGLFDFEASYYRVERIKIEWTKESNNDYLYLVSTNVNYTNGYTLGYYDGLNTIQYEKDNIINNQQEQINNLNNQVHELTLNVETLTQQVDAFNSDYNLNNLMWTIASTPFESFKQIWNVQFFGVNVSELLLGLITTFIALNIAKRFFF